MKNAILGRLLAFGLTIFLTAPTYADTCYTTVAEPLFNPAVVAQAAAALKAPSARFSLGEDWKDWSWVSSDDHEAIEEVYALYQRTYAKIGQVLSSVEGLGRREAIVNRSADGKIVAFLLGRFNIHGLMITQMGSDGTTAGLLALGGLMRREIPNGVYFQMSGIPLFALSRRSDIDIIPFERAREIRSDQGRDFWKPSPDELREAVNKKTIPDDPRIIDNAYFMRVMMDGKVHSLIKVMIGRPL